MDCKLNTAGLPCGKVSVAVAVDMPPRGSAIALLFASITAARLQSMYIIAAKISSCLTLC